ncbi:ABC transporter permease [Aminiphilus circumscriptus]|uniref:ABC transporter permease n=1 Tax=Aminiphilus circumscriptus TaxID=290732 RepID=UPI0004B8A676|nr:ABC transporter permease [Aminiphilus circumscriptus]
MRRLAALLVKEFIQMGRDRITLAIMVLIPVVQLMIFGFAINTEVKHLRTVVFDQSRSQQSRDLLDAFTASGYFDLTSEAQSFEDVEDAIQSGRVAVGIIVPPDFATIRNRGLPAPVQVLVDASDSMSSASAISAAQMLGMVQRSTRTSLGVGGNTAALPLYDVRIRPWYNPDLVSSHYMVPGILGTILTMTMIMLTAIAIVREREQGTLEQLLVTPLRTWELLAGKILPYVIVGYVQLTLGLLVGRLVFAVPLEGSLPLLYLLSLPFIVASLAWGVFISTVSRTQMQAMQLSFFVMLPSILLSGFMFPREAMPAFFFQISRLLPLTYFLQIARGILLKGVGIEHLRGQVLSLMGLIALFTIGSLLKFKKTLE